MTPENAGEVLHMQRMHAVVHGGDYTPPQLYPCCECRRRYQLSTQPGHAFSQRIRTHLIPQALISGTQCPGSLKPPLAACRTVTHYCAPPSHTEAARAVLACCGRHPGRVPAFGTFTADPGKVTCTGSPQQQAAG